MGLPMILRRLGRTALLASLVSFAPWWAFQTRAQKKEEKTVELPPELRGAKIYHLPDRTAGGKPAENPVIYKSLGYGDITLEKLVLNLFLSVRPVDRPAAVRQIYFQDVRVNGLPVEIETFTEEFKLSKASVVDLPAPLRCTLTFSDLESLDSVKEIVEKDKIRITGQSFIEVKLNALEKLALRTKQLVLPVQLDQDVPLQLFSDNPFLQKLVATTLDTLRDPSTSAAVRIAQEHLAKLTMSRTLSTTGRPLVYLLYCEYALRNPQTHVRETFKQLGTGFLVSGDGKLLTAKRVLEPWKFDPQVAFLMSRKHLQLDPDGYKVLAWPAGAQVLQPDGQPNRATALSTENKTLQVLKAAPDSMESRQYEDANSGAHSTVSVHASGENDLAIVQLSGNGFQSLPLADPGTKLDSDTRTALLGFPFGLSQPQAEPHLVFVKASREGSMFNLDRELAPGEAGAPLLTADGKVLALAGGSKECIPIELFRPLLQ